MISFDTEKCFEDFLFENQQIIIDSLELYPNTKILRQVQLGHYGICDLLCISGQSINDKLKYLKIDLIELKNTSIKSDHIIQCARYKTFFDNLSLEDFEIEFSCHLIGMATFKNDLSDLVFLCQSIEWLCVYECLLSPFEGLEFKLTSGWGKGNNNSHKTFFDDKVINFIDEIISEEKDTQNE